MESSIATTSVVVGTCVPAAVFFPSFSSSSFIWRALRTGQAFRSRCSSAAWQDSASPSPVPDDGALFQPRPWFESVEVMQWESGMTMNAIAAAQGIQVRRRFRTRYPAEGTGIDRAVPRSILEQIIWDKEVDVCQRMSRTPLHNVMAAAAPGVVPPPRDFLGSLRSASRRNGGVPALIAEVKKASPCKGLLREHFDPVEIAHAYANNGAACLSIVTDEKHFQGSFEILETVRNSAVSVRRES